MSLRQWKWTFRLKAGMLSVELRSRVLRDMLAMQPLKVSTKKKAFTTKKLKTEYLLDPTKNEFRELPKKQPAQFVTMLL